jgi:hypothetical protein
MHSQQQRQSTERQLQQCYFEVGKCGFPRLPLDFQLSPTLQRRHRQFTVRPHRRPLVEPVPDRNVPPNQHPQRQRRLQARSVQIVRTPSGEH